MKRLKWLFHVITFVLQAALSWVTSRRDAGPNLAAFAPSAIVEAHARTFAELSLKYGRLADEYNLTALPQTAELQKLPPLGEGGVAAPTRLHFRGRRPDQLPAHSTSAKVGLVIQSICVWNLAWASRVGETQNYTSPLEERFVFAD
jgi:hypothetical protein